MASTTTKNNYVVLGMVASGFVEFAKRLHESLGSEEYKLIETDDYRFIDGSKEIQRPVAEYKACLMATIASFQWRNCPFIFVAGFDRASNEVARALIVELKPIVIRINEVNFETTLTDLLTRWKRRLHDLMTTGTTETPETPEKMAKQIYYLREEGFTQLCKVMDDTLVLARSSNCNVIAASKDFCDAMYCRKTEVPACVAVGSSEVAPVAVGSGDVAVGSGDVSEGSGDVSEGSGDVAVGSSEVAVGSSEVAVGSGDVSEGSNLFSSSLNRIYGIQISNETLLRSSGLQ
jgi:hypothetical protein